VDRSLYEAAALDGASRVGLFRYMTLHGIRPTIALLVKLVTIWSFQRFTIIWLLTQGGPIGSTQTIVIMVCNNAFRYIDTGYGAAIGVVRVIMSLFVALLYFVVERRTSLEGAQ
jgi:multiple sugar transport system permease protein